MFSASKKKKKAKPKKSKESCRHIAFYQPHKKMNQNAQKPRKQTQQKRNQAYRYEDLGITVFDEAKVCHIFTTNRKCYAIGG